MRVHVSKKKKPSTSRASKPGHPARASASKNIVSIDAFRSRAAGQDLSAEFAAWLHTRMVIPPTGRELPVLSEFMKHYGAPGPTPVVLETHKVAATLEAHLPTVPADDSTFVLQLLLRYVEFLEDAHHWGGTELQSDSVQQLLLTLLNVGPETVGDEAPFEVPAIPREELLSVLVAMPLARRTHGFLHWFGSQRDVTESGRLTSQDIEAAAAALDVAALAVEGSPIESSRELTAAQRAMRAQDIPLADLYWESLLEIGAIEIHGSKASASGNALSYFTNPDDAQALVILLRDVALAMIRRFTNPEYAGGKARLSGAEEITADILVHACLGDGFPVADLAAWIPEDPSPQDMGMVHTLAALNTLAAEGIVEIGTNYTVPPALHKMIAFEFIERAGEPVHYADPKDIDPGYAGASG